LSPFQPEEAFDLKDGNKNPNNPPQFSTLPVEIRLMIWKFSLPPTREVVVRLELTDDEQEENMHQHPNPITLAINQESRSFTLEKYKPLFQLLKRPRIKRQRRMHSSKNKRRQCFVSDQDTVVFLNKQGETFPNICSGACHNVILIRNNIRHIEIRDFDYTDSSELTRRRISRLHMIGLVKLRNLETATLRMREHNWYDTGYSNTTRSREEHDRKSLAEVNEHIVEYLEECVDEGNLRGYGVPAIHVVLFDS
jgi:hypothetical protein